MGCITDLLFKKRYNLQEDLEFLRYDNDEEWHKLRQKGIGGSDIGAIMRLNEYTSPLMIYKQKIGEDTQNNENIFTKKGKDLEGFIRENYVKPVMNSLGYSVEHPEETIINSKYYWLRANIDGIAVPFDLSKKSMIIEIKFVSQFARKYWDKKEYSGIPASYYAQVQEYLLITGLDEAYVCALFDDQWEFKTYCIVRDEIFINNLIEKSKEFFFNNMQMGIPPKPDITLDKEDIANELDKEIQFEEDSSLNELVTKYREVSEKCNELDKEKTELSNKLKEAYLNGKKPSNSKNVYKVIKVSKTYFDSLRFGNDFPNLYTEYLKEKSYTTLKLK